MRRKSLDGAGGYKALANCLADDYQVGNRIAKNGGKVVLCPVVVECWDAPMDWRYVWKHQLRWARTIRVCQPLPYFFSILSNATLWPLLWFIAALIFTKTWCAPLTAIVFVLIRITLAQSLQRRFLQSARTAPFWLVPVKDLLQVAIWAAAFSGNEIEWRGRKMRLRPDGDLEAVDR
jgi:ceramide glucosyltransferase